MEKNEPSQPIYGTKVEGRDIMVPVRDGAKLAIDIYRPDAEGRFPALLAFSGHNKFLQGLRLLKRAITSLLGHPFGVGPQRVGIRSFSPQEVMCMLLAIHEVSVILILVIRGYKAERTLTT